MEHEHCSLHMSHDSSWVIAECNLQVDEWILAFVELLKDHCGIDPDKPLEVQEVRQALCAVCAALTLSMAC